MARPTAFTRQTSFTQFSSNFPSKQQNGASLDAEFNAAKVALDETQSNLALIQDDDGRLARGSVGRAQLDSSITLGFESPETWQPSTAYTADISTVFYTAKFYIALETHTSGATFDSTKWEEIADLSASAAIDDGSITEAKLASSAVTADKIQSLAVTTTKIASSAVTTAKIADEAVTIGKVDSAAGPDLAALILPAGLGPLPWPSNTAPTGWVFDGGTYLRADYPALATFALAQAALSNPWFTVGDGSTTFTIKNAEGLALVGADTDGSTVGSALAVGATIGASTKTLGQTNLPNVNFTVDIPAGQGAHAHGYVEPLPASATGGTGGNPRLTTIDSSSGTNNATLPAMSGTAASGGSATPISLFQPSVGVRYIFKAH